MKNNYVETVKYLNVHNKPVDANESIVIDINNTKLNKDFSYLINEMEVVTELEKGDSVNI